MAEFEDVYYPIITHVPSGIQLNMNEREALIGRSPHDFYISRGDLSHTSVLLTYEQHRVGYNGTEYRSYAIYRDATEIPSNEKTCKFRQWGDSIESMSEPKVGPMRTVGPAIVQYSSPYARPVQVNKPLVPEFPKVGAISVGKPQVPVPLEPLLVTGLYPKPSQ